MTNDEKDPSGKNPKESGAKLDNGKAPLFRGLLDYFPRACLAVAEVSQRGAEKYCWKGWENVEDGINRYSDAIVRHICKESIEGRIDPDFGLLHKAHVAWNALAVLELELRKDLDNRTLSACKDRFRNKTMPFAGFPKIPELQEKDRKSVV